MQPSNVPIAGTLSARIIRACTTHDQCSLDCPERKTEDLGQIAGFDSKEKIWPLSSQTSEKQS